jgi:hypothetical protein
LEGLKKVTKNDERFEYPMPAPLIIGSAFGLISFFVVNE